MNCDLCRWFASETIKSEYNHKTKTFGFFVLGTCRRHSPERLINFETGHDWSGWPETLGTDWCAEWEEVLDGPPRENKPGRSRSDTTRTRQRMTEMAKRANQSHRK